MIWRLPICFCLSIYLSLWSYISLSHWSYISLSLCLSVSLSFCLSVYLCLCFFLSLSLFYIFYFSITIYVIPFVSLSLCFSSSSSYQHVCVSVRFICPHGHLWWHVLARIPSTLVHQIYENVFINCSNFDMNVFINSFDFITSQIFTAKTFSSGARY